MTEQVTDTKAEPASSTNQQPNPKTEAAAAIMAGNVYGSFIKFTRGERNAFQRHFGMSDPVHEMAHDLFTNMLAQTNGTITGDITSTIQELPYQDEVLIAERREQRVWELGPVAVTATTKLVSGHVQTIDYQSVAL